MTDANKLLIKQARLFDPAQQLNGEVRDLYLAGGKISEPFDDPQKVIDAAGRAVLAGGIDPYCMLAAPGQAFAHLMVAFPPLEEIGQIYARLGYVHLHHPFTTLLTANLVHQALADIPIMDKSTGVVIDLRDMGRFIKSGKIEEFSLLARALLDLSGALKLFLPFPHLRHKQRHYIQKNLSAKKVLGFLARIDDPDLLPFTLWAGPDLFKSEIPEAGRFHIAGLGLALDSPEAVEQAGLFLESGGSADLGLSDGREQLIIGPACGSLPELHLSIDSGLLAPLHFYTQAQSFDAGLTRAGWSFLEQANSSWFLSLSASGPAGGQFGRMAAVAAWLADAGARPEGLRQIYTNSDFSLYDLARHTRFEPARCLGLPDMGHLQPGADGHVAIYDIVPGMDTKQMQAALTDCWCLIKDGIPVREDGKFTGAMPPSKIHRREVEVELSSLANADLLQNSTLRFEQLRAG